MDTTAVSSLTTLYWAAAQGHHEVVAQLVAQCAKVIFSRNAEGWNVMHVATREGHVKVVSQLLQYSPNLIATTTNCCGSTSLHIAARQGHATLFQQLLCFNPKLIETLDSSGSTVLHVVAKDGNTLGHEHIAHLLLTKNPSMIFAVDQNGNTPLHLAVTGRNERLMSFIYRCNKEAVHALNKDRQNPFHLALLRENEGAIKMLQWGLYWDELVSTVLDCETRQNLLRLRAILDQLCEGLVVVVGPNLTHIVCEYLGLDLKRN